jgi:Helix-turn-helix
VARGLGGLVHGRRDGRTQTYGVLDILAKIERSEREPGVRTVSKLARALEVSASELFEGIDGRDAREDDG